MRRRDTALLLAALALLLMRGTLAISSYEKAQYK